MVLNTIAWFEFLQMDCDLCGQNYEGGLSIIVDAIPFRVSQAPRITKDEQIYWAVKATHSTE